MDLKGLAAPSLRAAWVMGRLVDDLGVRERGGKMPQTRMFDEARNDQEDPSFLTPGRPYSRVLEGRTSADGDVQSRCFGRWKQRLGQYSDDNELIFDVFACSILSQAVCSSNSSHPSKNIKQPLKAHSVWWSSRCQRRSENSEGPNHRLVWSLGEMFFSGL